MLRMRVWRPFFEQICSKPAFWALRETLSQRGCKPTCFYSVLATRTLWFCRTGGLQAQNTALEAFLRANLLKTRVLRPLARTCSTSLRGERGTPLPSDAPLPLARKGPQKRAGGPVGCSSSVMQRPRQWQIFHWRSPPSGIPNPLHQSCRRRLHVRRIGLFLSGFEPGRAGPAQTFHLDCGRCAILGTSLAFAWQGRPFPNLGPDRAGPFPNLSLRSWNTISSLLAHRLVASTFLLRITPMMLHFNSTPSWP